MDYSMDVLKEAADTFITADVLYNCTEYQVEDRKFNFDSKIFKFVSEEHCKENFHSDIICRLLKNKIFLKNFLYFIGIEHSNYEKNVSVVRE